MIIVKLFLQIKEEILQDFNMTPEDKKNFLQTILIQNI